MQRTIKLLRFKSFVQDSLRRKDFLLSFHLVLITIMVINHYTSKHISVYDEAYV